MTPIIRRCRVGSIQAKLNSRRLVHCHVLPTARPAGFRGAATAGLRQLRGDETLLAFLRRRRPNESVNRKAVQRLKLRVTCDFNERTGLNVLRASLMATVNCRIDDGFFDAWAFGIGIAANHPDDFDIVFGGRFTVHFELDGVARAAVEAIAVASDFQHVTVNPYALRH